MATRIVVRRLREEKAWLPHPRKLVYGRRKTGKSFFVREFTKYDAYFFVFSDGSIRLEGREVSYDVLLDRIRRGERVVVDEFHRLPKNFLDFLHAEQPENIVLITSTRFRAKELIEQGSPILGLFHPVPFSIISPLDVLRALKDHFQGRDLLERAVYYREPILLNYGDVSLVDALLSTIHLVPSITSEIFKEEEKRLNETYEAILRVVAGGSASYGKISSYVTGRVDVTPTSLTYHLKMLKEIGLIGTREILGSKRRFLYRHISPLFDLYYYMDKKYGISELGYVPREALRERIPVHVEWFAEEFFAELFKLKPVKIFEPEVDIALTRFKRLVFLGEVKWKERLSKKEVREVEKKFDEVEKKFGEAERKVLVVPDAGGVPETELEVWDVERMVEEVGVRGVGFEPTKA